MDDTTDTTIDNGVELLTHMHVRISESTARRTRAAADLLGLSPSECTEEALVEWLAARGIPQAGVGGAR